MEVPHDQIDHGAIQLNRMVNRGANNVHVSHLIIDPVTQVFRRISGI